MFGHGVPEVSVDSVMAAGGEFPDFEHKRMETISRLWNITETLNVLYRENWTVMANVEIIKFQNEMIQSIREEMRETEGRSHQSCNKVITREKFHHFDHVSIHFGCEDRGGRVFLLMLLSLICCTCINLKS